jgi:hypothetical protein
MSGLTYSDGKGDYSQGVNKTYITNAAFNNDFYTYTVTTNSSFQKVGTFTLVSGATATTCPANRVLHLTGNRLFPNVHPMNTFVGGLSTAGVTSPGRFMVKVYDPITFLSGFIDPTNTKFSNFDQNLPNFFNLGSTGANPPLGGQDGELVAKGQVRSGTVTVNSTGTGGTYTIDPTLGQVFTFTATQSSAVTIAVTANSAAAAPGSVVYVLFSNGGGQTIIGSTTATQVVKTLASQTMTTAMGYSMTLVSDGTVFRQVAAAQLST